MKEPNHDIQNEKARFRQRVRSILEALPSEHRAQSSNRARELLKQQKIWMEARSVLFYAPLTKELDVWPLLQEAVVAKKEVVLPRFDPDSDAYVVCRLTDLNDTLPPGKFGILEPHHDSPPYPLNQLDLVLVPGVAFDIGGRRLGRGKGFYDRLLASVSGTKCGVAFDEQVESALPWEPHDVTMDCLVTPSRWLDLRRSGNA